MKLKEWTNLCLQKKRNAPYNIRFYNFWEQDNAEMWFYRFVQKRHLLNGKHKSICFFSVFGPRNLIGHVKGDVKVFFSGENLKRGGFNAYSDHCLNDGSVDLALGFEYFEALDYLRFPLWVQYMFEPECNEDDIVKRCEQLNRPHMDERPNFSCHISREDELGLRREICRNLERIDRVDCAGKVMHNCENLWQVYGDDKKRFMSSYKFNVCPENSNAFGYVTEKVFQAIDAGCVPIYWGSYNQPEPEVLNHEAVLFWDKNGDNSKLLDFMSQLSESPSLYEDFARQKRLKESAADYVIGKFDQLERRIKALL